MFCRIHGAFSDLDQQAVASDTVPVGLAPSALVPSLLQQVVVPAASTSAKANGPAPVNALPPAVTNP